MGAALSPDEPVTFNEYQPWLTKHHGPEKAKGVIYFMHGWDAPEAVIKDDFHHNPYILNSLSSQGWDVIASKVFRDKRVEKFDPRIADYLIEKAAKLRAGGYKRVIMGGYTWGAWNILRAERLGLKADALLLFSPAAFGYRTNAKGMANPNFIKNRTNLINLLKSVRNPVALILFDKDEFDPGGRNELAAKQLEANNVPHLFINSPAGFAGAFGEFLPIFDYLYGTCIERFLVSPKQANCVLQGINQSYDNNCIQRFLTMSKAGPCLSPNITSSDFDACSKQLFPFLDSSCTSQDFAQLDFCSVVSLGQILGRKKSIGLPSIHFIGKSFVIYDISSRVRTITFTDTMAEIHTLSGDSITPWNSTNGRLCLGGECQIIRLWDNGNYHGFDDKGAISSWWIRK